MYQSVLNMFTEIVRSERFDSLDETYEDLRERCDNVADWNTAEIDVVLAHEELSQTISPVRLARRYLERARESVDHELLQQLAWLFSAEHRHWKMVGEQLDGSVLGSLLGAKLNLADAEAPIGLIYFFRHAPPATLGATLLALLGRCEEKKMRKLIYIVLRESGLERIQDVLPAESLSPAMTTLMTRILLKILKPRRASASSIAEPDLAQKARLTSNAVGLLGRLLGSLSRDAATAALMGLPSAIVPHLSHLFLRPLRELDAKEVGALLSYLRNAPKKDGVDWALPVLLQAVHETQGKNWSSRELYATLKHILARGRGEDLVKMVQERQHGTDLRTCAIDALESDRELFREAIKPRVGEILEPVEIKNRLKAARRRLQQMDRSSGRSGG